MLLHQIRKLVSLLYRHVVAADRQILDGLREVVVAEAPRRIVMRIKNSQRLRDTKDLLRVLIESIHMISIGTNLPLSQRLRCLHPGLDVLV